MADMIGASQMIDEAMTIREEVGRVGEVTWSKVQSTALALSRTQAYALRQLDALAEKLERKAEMGELASVAKDAEAKGGRHACKDNMTRRHDSARAARTGNVEQAMRNDSRGFVMGWRRNTRTE